MVTPVEAHAPGRAVPRSGAPGRVRAPGPSAWRLLARVVVRLLAYGVLVTLVLAVLYPLLWMLLSSFKDNAEVFGDPWGLPSQLRWGNFDAALRTGVLRYFLNSVLVTTVSIVSTTMVSAWAAYGLTRMRLPFQQPILLLVLGGLMLAPTVAIIPLFRLLQTLGIFDTYWALIVLYTAFRIPFTTFLIRAYLIDLPVDVDEAATIDGASPTQIFWWIILPMSRPILVSAALLQALFAWNEFVFALVFVSRGEMKTLPVGLMDAQSRLLTDWPVQFAGLTMAALPMIILFLIGQRQFLRGLTEGVGK